MYLFVRCSFSLALCSCFYKWGQRPLTYLVVRYIFFLSSNDLLESVSRHSEISLLRIISVEKLRNGTCKYSESTVGSWKHIPPEF